jgi:hypothetical protein
MSVAYIVIDYDCYRDDFVWVFRCKDAAIEFARARYEYYLRDWEISQDDIDGLNREYYKLLTKRNDPNTGKPIEPEPYYGFILLDEVFDVYLGFKSRWLVRASWTESDYGIYVREVPYEA